MQASASALRSKQRNSWRCSSKRCKRKPNRRQPATSAHAHHSKQVPKQMQILQRLLPKLGGDKAYRHRCNPSAISLQSEQHGNANASIVQTCRSFFPQQIPPHETTRSSWVKHMSHPQDHNIALSGNWVTSQQHGHTAGVRGCPTAVILGATS